MLKSTDARQDALRSLPSVEAVLADEALAPLRDVYRHGYLTGLVREELERLRSRLWVEDGTCASVPSASELAEVVRDMAQVSGLSLRRVINASGTVIHTNLGRSLLAERAVEAVRMAATHAVNLEYDLVAGRRGHRDLLTEAMLMRLTGADAAAVVNNNAAAVLLALHALAAGREVIVSRGELVEIGGSFRIPDVMRAAGVVLREVGTTNRTHLSDYADAISDETALLLKVHPSNYRVEGFTSEVGLSELVGLGRERGLSVMEDLGSGALIDLSAWGVTGEPLVRERVEAGTDIVTFSGDKLLGGPQAGIIVGAKALVEVVRRDPLMRAVRVDKLTYAALAATLDIYERSAHPERELPMLRAMSRSVDDLEGLAARCVEKWDGWLDGQASVEVRPSEAQVGSGAQPTARLESVAIVFVPVGASAVDIAASLRAADVPVIARIEDGCVWMDMRAMHDDDLAALDAAVSHVVRHFARLGASG